MQSYYVDKEKEKKKICTMVFKWCMGRRWMGMQGPVLCGGGGGAFKRQTLGETSTLQLLYRPAWIGYALLDVSFILTFI
jgi:hypothetical protein